mmetsp:Transcript_27716/g.79750  ORF Transcript_27716/g.79750 Transcript_27716/m.79750 type:complete len:115 (+) Transcript_27716:595-939(+)
MGAAMGAMGIPRLGVDGETLEAIRTGGMATTRISEVAGRTMGALTGTSGHRTTITGMAAALPRPHRTTIPTTAILSTTVAVAMVGVGAAATRVIPITAAVITRATERRLTTQVC